MAGGVLKNLAKALGLNGIPEPHPGVDRITQLEESANVARSQVARCREDVEACYVALEEGMPGAAEQLQKAEAELTEAEQIAARLDAALRAAKRIQTERERKEREQTERAAWRAVGKANLARVEQAKELVGLIQRVGALYKSLADSGRTIYLAMPRKPYAIDGMLLDEGMIYHTTAVELALAGLPSSVRLAQSVLAGMPGLVAKLEDAAKLVASIDSAALDAEAEKQAAFLEKQRAVDAARESRGRVTVQP